MVKVDPSRADNWVFLGNINEMRGDTTRAIDAYQKALDLTSDNEKALYQIYQLYRSTENWDGLVSTFSKILEKDPANPDIRLILAEGLYYHKNYERVSEILQPLLDLESYQSQAYRLLGMIASEEENFSEAEKYFKKITEIDPKNKFGWLSLAYVYNQQGHFNRSVYILQDAIAHLPDDVDILGLYGSTLNQVKRYHEALKFLKTAYQKDPKNLNTIISLGVVYEELGMYTESDSLHENALRIYPDEALLLNNYSYSLGVRGKQLTRALEMAERAIQMDSTNGAFLDTIGWIHFKLGNFEQAKAYILNALSHRENSAEVIEHLGDVYYKLGDLNKAREYWQQASEIEPENDSLKKKLDNNEI
jgi:tetratricopeptide (TPR) repeat protein